MADFFFGKSDKTKGAEMNTREILVSEKPLLACGPVCERCHIAVGLSESDKIELDGRIWHGACFDRLPLPPDVSAGVDAVLDDLMGELVDGPDKSQLAVMHARFRREAVIHRSPTGSARRNIAAFVQKLSDMQDVPRARGRSGLVRLLSASVEALKSIAADHLPRRRLVLLPRLSVSLAVGSSGMFYDRRDDRKRRAM
jgi:hypothetical protein